MAAPHRPPTDKRLTTRDIVADLLRDFTDADRGMLGTFVQLSIRPRRVVGAYLEGDRRRFIRPTRYLAFTLSLSAAAFFLIQYWYGTSLTEIMLEHSGPGFAAALEDDLAARQLEYSLSAEEIERARKQNAQLTESARRVYRFLFEYYSVFFVAFVPVGATIHRAFYPRNTFTLAESVVASLYIYSHSNLLAIVLIPVCILFSSTPYAFLNSLFIGYAITCLYMLFAVQQTYAHRWWEFFVAWLGLGFAFYITLLVAYGLGNTHYILFQAEDTGRYILQHPARVTFVVSLLLGCLYWFWLLYRLRFGPRTSRTQRRSQFLVIALVSVALIVIRLLL